MTTSWRTAFLGACFLTHPSLAIAAEAPWRMAQERYSCCTSDATLQELASGGVTVLSHVPAAKEYCEEARRWGIKVCPYVSLYKVMDSSSDKRLVAEPFWKEIDASKHPEWYLRREDGQIRKPFDNPQYQVYYQQSCCNHRDLMEAYERGVRNVMDLGAGGVFVDNVHPHPQCFGTKLGLHTHDWPDKDNTACYKMALRRLYDAVKSYGEDRVVILNTGGRNGEYQSYGDVQMWESWCWDGSVHLQPRSADDLLTIYRRWRSFAEQGAAITTLTYLPEPASEAENAFFAYATARVAGSDQWTGIVAKRRDILRRLYRVQTGPATSEPVENGGALYRQFQNALIVCNFSARTVEARAPLPPGLGAAPVELYGMQTAAIVAGHAVLSLPPESGRVIVARAEALDNLLREVHGQALAARLQLERKDAGRNKSSAETVTKQLQSIETRAAGLRKNVREPTFPADAQRDALTAVCKDAAAVPTPSEGDPLLTERLDNLRRHADLLVVLVAK